MNYRQLTLDERYQIQILLKLQTTPAEIARQLGRHRSTISRELARNSVVALQVPYKARRAQRIARLRRVAMGVAARKIQGELQILVEQKLRLSWSPEQIAGRLRLECGIAVSHETIYQHVLRDAQACGFLRYCLRFGGYKQHRFRRSHHAAKNRLRKRWLEARPAAANDRTELGHWERDCLLGAQACDAVLLTLVDRRSRFTRIRAVARQTSEAVADATVEALRPHQRTTKSITNDNGVEFQRDATLQARLGVPIFFTAPSSPWQRGSIENLNGLVRQYIPKGADLDHLAPWMPRALEDTLNFRPRKILGYRSPHEVFFDRSVRLMTAPLMRFGLEFSGAS
jgi:IS30 family transposase